MLGILDFFFTCKENKYSVYQAFILASSFPEYFHLKRFRYCHNSYLKARINSMSALETMVYRSVLTLIYKF